MFQAIIEKLIANRSLVKATVLHAPDELEVYWRDGSVSKHRSKCDVLATLHLKHVKAFPGGNVKLK